jgi:hypothetical protein
MSSIKFLSSRLFLKNLLYAIILTIGLLIFIFQALKIYTRHNQVKLVPDFTGMTISEVKETCKKNKLRYEITDSVFLSNWKMGTVVEQNPIPDFRVKKNRTIFLIINATNPELVTMPNVIGVSFRQAKALIEAKGLQAGKMEYIQDMAINNVLGIKFKGQEIKKGDKIPRFSSIDFVLGNGYGHHHTYLPDLTGFPLIDVKEKIINSYCNLGSILFDNTVKNKADSNNAIVYKQFPKYNDDPVKHGTYIDIWLTTDPDKLNQSDTLSSSLIR